MSQDKGEIILNNILQKLRRKRVVLKSSSTKRNESDRNHRKKLFCGVQNLVDESVDLRLN